MRLLAVSMAKENFYLFAAKPEDDVDSYAIVSRTLSDFTPGFTNFQIAMENFSIATACKNIKMMDALVQNVCCTKTCSDDERKWWLEFVLGGHDLYRTFVLLRVDVNRAPRGMRWRRIILDNCVIPAFHDMSPTSRTKMDNSFTSRTTVHHKEAIKMHPHDWPEFCQLLTSRINQLQIGCLKEVFFYRCQHGLKLAPSLAQAQLSQVVVQKPRSIVTFQLHFATELAPKQDRCFVYEGQDDSWGRSKDVQQIFPQLYVSVGAF